MTACASAAVAGTAAAVCTARGAEPIVADAPGLAAVEWKSGRCAGPVLMLADLRGHHCVVELHETPTLATRRELARAGVALLAPLSGRVFFATVAPEADVESAAPLVCGAAEIRDEWRLHPSLLAGEAPGWTIVTGGIDPEVAVYITLHADAPLDTAAPLVAAHGGRVVDRLVSVNAVVAHLPSSVVKSVAAEDLVQWVEPALPRLGEANAENRAMTGAGALQAAPYGLNGAGISVLVFDVGGVRSTHVDFQGRVTQVDTAAWAAHPTHVAGTVGGAGVANANHRGMAPGVTILSAGLRTVGEPEWLYSNPSDLETDYTAAYAQGADIATNSLSTNISQSTSPCSWEGDYATTDAVIDAIVRGDSAVTGNTPFRVMWAGGNERTNSRCGSMYYTVPPPSGAKNHLSIGAVNSDSDLVSNFSSWGPTDDGRMKPDFCAPGCQLGGDNGVTSCGYTSNTAYSSICGTSMAAPTVAGVTALLLQDWRVRYPGLPDPRNSTLKAAFAQSAVDRGNPGPDFQYGYGSIRGVAAIELLRSEQWREGAVSQGSDAQFVVMVAPGATELALTAAWDDVPGTPNVVPSLVNDLDLEVHSPSGARAYPWTLDPANPAVNATRTDRNSRDNLEQVRVTSPEAGAWGVRVRAFSAPVGPQTFSLVSSHPVTDLTCDADFDGDGDTGTDADIEAFFACLGGSCCATCDDADFDNDGDVGTDMDIEAFFRVLGGGAC